MTQQHHSTTEQAAARRPAIFAASALYRVKVAVLSVSRLAVFYSLF